MIYKYVPDSYDMSILRKENINYDIFVSMQVKYRHGLEAILKKRVNFKQLDIILNRVGFEIPMIQDLDYNFYHKFSTLGSRYFYFRNNIHIETLNHEELGIILNSLSQNEELSEQFILNTIERVIFESGDKTFYGIPTDKNLVSSKAIVFEFAYDDLKCNLTQGKRIEQIYLKLKNAIEKVLKQFIQIPIEFVVNEGYEKIYKIEEGIEKQFK